MFVGKARPFVRTSIRLPSLLRTTFACVAGNGIRSVTGYRRHGIVAINLRQRIRWRPR